MRKLKGMFRFLVVLWVILALPAGSVAEGLAADQQLNAYYTLMTLALSQGEYENALEYAQQCMALEDVLDDSVRADIWLKQGYALVALQRLDEALEALDKCLTLMPEAADAMLLKMQVFAAQGDSQASMAQAETYHEVYPEQTEVYSTLGEVFAAGGDFANAVEAYNRYLELAPDKSSEAYEMRGQYLLQLGQYEAAVTDLTQAIEMEDGTADARTHYLRAIAQMQLNAYDAAISDLNVCVEYLDAQQSSGTESQIDPDVLNSHYYRGIAGMQSGDFEMAIQDFTKCMETDINAGYAQFWRGACYLDSGKYEPAMSDFAACSEAGIEVESCLYYTALCHMGLEEYDSAVAGFTDCINQGVMTGQALYSRGMCYIQLGDTQKGQADLEQSVGAQSETVVPDSPTDEVVVE